MGVRGELFSTRIILPNRTYFFNVKENRMGDLYLNIVESKNKETGGFDRQSVILFADDLQQFLKGFDESLKVMEKAVREKRHGASGGRTQGDRAPRDSKEHDNFSGEKRNRPDRGGNRSHSSGGKFSKNFKTDRGHDHKPEGGRHEGGKREGGRRVVVRNKKDFNR